MNSLNRRRFLKTAVISTVATCCPPVFARSLRKAERKIRLYNLHTGEKFSHTYWAEGTYYRDALAEINYLLRDHRNGQRHAISHDLIDVISILSETLKPNGVVHVISGYRSPETNKKLRQKSQGVAKHSLHMDGMAIDIRLPGVPLSLLHDAAVAMKAGGVGVYPKSQFVHMDVGRVRYWSG